MFAELTMPQLEELLNRVSSIKERLSASREAAVRSAIAVEDDSEEETDKTGEVEELGRKEGSRRRARATGDGTVMEKLTRSVEDWARSLRMPGGGLKAKGVGGMSGKDAEKEEEAEQEEEEEEEAGQQERGDARSTAGKIEEQMAVFIREDGTVDIDAAIETGREVRRTCPVMSSAVAESPVKATRCARDRYHGPVRRQFLRSLMDRLLASVASGGAVFSGALGAVERQGGDGRR